MPRFLVLSLTALLLALWTAPAALAQSKSGGPRIEWEVKNRFRLFRSEADFQRHVAADRGDGLLAAEDRLARESDGRGWARDTVERLCVDRAGKLLETCDRDGTLEDYLVPRDHSIGVALAGTIPANVGCDWSVDDGTGPPRETMARCEEEVKLRIAYGRTTLASVDILLPDGTAQRVVTDIAVRDVLIAGLGDSIAAGEGNPDRPVRLSNEGFCFQRFLGTARSEYYRPGRDGFNGNKSCSSSPGDESQTEAWARQSARWESGPCHRSLYSYQLRSALGLAVENSHIAVTFIPLGCTGARIDAGFLASQRISECPSPGTSAACPGSSPAQIDELKELMARAHKRQPDRNIDLVLLTIGANDILFSGLIANVIIESTTDRILLGRGGSIATVADFAEDPRQRTARQLRQAARRAQALCGRRSFARGVRHLRKSRAHLRQYALRRRARRLRRSSGVFGQQHPPASGLGLPRRAIPAEDQGAGDVRRLDLPRSVEREHDLRGGPPGGFCQSWSVRALERRSRIRSRLLFAQWRQLPRPIRGRPPPIRWPAGGRRASIAPMRRAHAGSEPRTTATLRRSPIRRASPRSCSRANIHDATWGIMSAVYGGAIHPTAEGHAAMADATLPTMRSVLGLQPMEAPVHSEPLPPVNVSAPPRVVR